MSRKRIAVVLGALLVAGVVGVNAVAYRQARAMTHFAAAGERTKRPQELGTLEVLWVVLAGVNVPRPENSSTPADVGLPFALHHVESSAGTMLEAWYIPGTRDAPLVLAFHGYAGKKSDLLPAAQAIRALGSPVFLVDLRGSCGSSGSETSLGYRDGDDVAAILRAIAADGVAPDGIMPSAPRAEAEAREANHGFHGWVRSHP